MCHIISAVPSPLVLDFALRRDEAISATFDTIQQEITPMDSTHTLPVGAGGLSLRYLASHAADSYLGAFFRVVGPLQQRLVAMGASLITLCLP